MRDVGELAVLVMLSEDDCICICDGETNVHSIVAFASGCCGRGRQDDGEGEEANTFSEVSLASPLVWI